MLAILAMNVFAFGSVAVSVIFKGIQQDGVSVVEFTLFRNLFNFTAACILTCAYRINPVTEFPPNLKGLMLSRALLGQLCFASFQFCLLLLPLSLQMILFQTSPFWAGILGWFINGEKIMRLDYIGMIICFGGVLAITFSKHSETTDTDEIDDGSSTRLYGIALAFAIAWFFAGCGVLNRSLKNLHFSMVLFYHAATGIVLAVTFILLEHWITGNPFRIYTARQYGMILACCVFDFLTVNSQTIAF